MLARLFVRRLIQLFPVLLGITFLTFVVVSALPGDTAEAILGANASSQSLAALRTKLGLNSPFLVRYWHWLVNALHGNIGNSLTTGQSVSSMLLQRVPVTAELLVLSFGIAIILAILVAVLSAVSPNGVFSRIATVISMIGLSVPNFIVGLVLILVLSVKFRVFPSSGYSPITAGLGANLRTMVLPALALGFALFGTYARLLRGDMADLIASEDYVVAARAKGLREQAVIVRHVLRNSLFGLVTLAAANFGTLIGGTVIIESLFGLPGLGQLLIDSINNRDVIVVQGVVVFIAVVVVAANLLADILYAVLDPRVRYGSSVA